MIGYSLKQMDPGRSYLDATSEFFKPQLNLEESLLA